MLYFGGPVTALLTVSTLAVRTCTEMLTNYWISYWVKSAAEAHGSYTLYHLWVYVALCLANEAMDSISTYAFMRGILTAATRLHEELITSIMDVSLSWFTDNAVGRIINRLSGDMSNLDQGRTYPLSSAFRVIINAVLMVGTVTSLLPPFILPAIVLATIGALITIIYNRTALTMKQLISASQSPILSEFSEGMNGMAVIRATRSTTPFVFYIKMNKLLYASVQARSAQIELGQWLKFRMNVLAAGVDVAAAMLALRQQNTISAGLVGFCLSQASQISDLIQWLVFSLSELNVAMQAVSCPLALKILGNPVSG